MSYFCLILLVFGGFFTPADAQYTIRTIAGDGPADGVSATAIALGLSPSALVTGSGDIYLPSPTRNRVFKLSGGLITTVAGIGAAGFSGDGGPATSATLHNPTSVAIDAAGALYIADTGNSRIRRVSTTGIITTFAGTGMMGHAGDGSSATSAWLWYPHALLFDAAGNLIFAEHGRIRKISPNGIISSIAGNGTFSFTADGAVAATSSLGHVASLALDSAGVIYFAEASANRIRKITTAGLLATVAGNGDATYAGDGGPALNASLSNPRGIAVDPGGVLFIADTFNHRIRRVSAGLISTVAGSHFAGTYGDGGPAINARCFSPEGVFADAAGNLLLNDAEGALLRKIATDGTISTIAGNGTRGLSGDGGLAVHAQLFAPQGIAVTTTGTIYFADQENHRVRILTPDGKIANFAGGGISVSDGVPAGTALLSIPTSVALDPSGNLYVANAGRQNVLKVTPAGMIATVAGTYQRGYSGDGGPAIAALLYSPWDVALDPAGNLLIADELRLRKVTPSGIINTVAGNGIRGFSGDGGVASSAQFSAIVGVATDSFGNVFLSDNPNHRIRKIAADGIVSTVAGNGSPALGGDGGPATTASLSYPRGVAADSNGNLFIADTGNHRIVKVLSNGAIFTIAGTGTPGFTGDAGPATSAQLNNPTRVAVDVAGNVYIADTTNNRIRILSPSLTTQPSSLHFQYTRGGTAPATQSVAVTPAPATLTASITTNSGGAWLAATKAGSQPASFTVSVSPESLTAGSFSGLIRLSSAGVIKDIPVTLTVSDSSSCTYALSPASVTVPATATSATFTVNVPPGCSWTANSTSSWIAIASGASGLTSAAVTLQLQPNTGTARMGAVTVVNQSFFLTQSAAGGASPGLRFVPVVPCRVIDSRLTTLFSAAETRAVNISSSPCGIPSNAAAYSLNVTVVPSGPLGYLTIWPTGQSQPLVSTLNAFDGRIKANAAIVPAGTNGAVSVFVTNPTHVILEINGYFTSTTGAGFYPTPPCRISDSRPNALPAGQTRTIPIAIGPCTVPPTATAYSLNFTAVPIVPLGYLTTWPNGQSQPLVSTLNAPTAAVTANAAIVPAGISGRIDVFVTNPTDLVIDVNGYFAPHGGANERTFYPVAPCRVLDTRPNAILHDGDTRTIHIPSSPCNIPASAKAFALNATVVPSGPLSYLTLWPADSPQPPVSTLNAFDGTVTSNAAIVPAAANGSIKAFVTNTTHLILDINGYFQ